MMWRSTALGGSQQEKPAKSPTASRWCLGVDRREEDDDFVLHFEKKIYEAVRCAGLWLGWSWAVLVGFDPGKFFFCFLFFFYLFCSFWFSNLSSKLFMQIFEQGLTF
jgi:hypothetical protein